MNARDIALFAFLAITSAVGLADVIGIVDEALRNRAVKRTRYLHKR